jgi:hypothetical protein
MAAVWLGGVAAVAAARAVARPRPSTLVFVDLVLLALTLVVLAPEGGWWFVPAVAAQTPLDRRAAARVADDHTTPSPRRCSRRPGRPRLTRSAASRKAPAARRAAS